MDNADDLVEAEEKGREEKRAVKEEPRSPAMAEEDSRRVTQNLWL